MNSICCPMISQSYFPLLFGLKNTLAGKREGHPKTKANPAFFSRVIKELYENLG